MRGPIRLRLTRAPLAEAAYDGQTKDGVAEGWYLVVLSSRRPLSGGVARLSVWSADGVQYGPELALARGTGRKLAVAFLPRIGGRDRLKLQLYGVPELPDDVRLSFVPVPRALAAPSVGLQNLGVLRTAFAAARGSPRARLRAAFSAAADAGQAVPARFAGLWQADLYRRWIRRFDTLGTGDAEAIRRTLPGLPSLLVLCLFDRDSAANAPELVADLQRQRFGAWRAVLAFARDGFAVPDPRFTTIGDPALAGEGLHDGECLVLVDGRMRLRDHALSTLAAALQPGTRMVYADEDRIDPAGERSDPFFKPGFSPELLRHMDYLGGCVLLAGPGLDALAQAALQAGAAGPVLRDHAAGLAGDAVVHVPLIAAHATTPPPSLPDLPDAALSDGELPTVSIIVPTRDRLELLSACLASIEQRTDYDRSRMEILVVDNASSDPATLTYLAAAAAGGRLRVLRDDGAFNYSRLNNEAVAASRAEIVVFLNNDTEIDDAAWLRRLAAYAVQPDVGAVGCKLLYPDRTVQHAGVVVGMAGVAAHIGVGLAEDDPGYHGFLGVTREVAAVTAACLAIRRTVFLEAGGLDPALAVAFNDVALCIALLDLGYRNLCVAAPLVIHHESKSRGMDDTPEKVSRFDRESTLARRLVREDPFYSPNLDYLDLYALADPPRRSKPWRAALGRRQTVRVLLLSSTRRSGVGMAAIVEHQAASLAAAGYAVTVGGPPGNRDRPDERWGGVVLQRARDAAAFAVETDTDWVVAHSMPFLSVGRWLGREPRVVICDHGEAAAGLSTNMHRQSLERAERLICLDLAYAVLNPGEDLVAYVSSFASQ